MDSLFKILANRDYDEPPEIQVIKEYVRKKYESNAEVAIRDKDIVIGVRSAALASRLRFDIQSIKKLIDSEKNIILRITG